MNNLVKMIGGGILAIGFFAVQLSGAVAANYNVQDLIGTYKNKSSVCEDGSKVGHLIPCARHCDNPDTPGDETEPCSVCHLIVLGHNIVEYIVFIAVFIAFAIIVFAGVMYIVSAGDQGMITTAKAALKAALFGMAFVLAAWVVVNTLITVFLKPNKDTFLRGDWRQYYCESVDNSNANLNSGGNSNANPSSGGNSNANPSSGGNSNANPSSGGTTNGGSATKTGPASKVDPTVYSGTKYCGITPTVTHVVGNKDECYTDEAYCKNKFGDKCVAFKDHLSKPYDQYHVELNIIAPLQNNKELIPMIITDIPANKSNINPAKDCYNFIEEMKKVAENANGELRVPVRCQGRLVN